ncbi:IS4 family transposase [Nodularia sp. LEGE 06071]|uniref:IS4 family transposase n=1 Tax=Nodularia sp. LEGE 06071 TaxID=2777965 RepID=UPI001882069E|nr:IS4 family transposase [Nodularia sp. LEGE 06071]MBE9202147.1 IS4 family transposase [Nodularia sp. LEGE 06071]
MNKSTDFVGQPIFSQLLSLIGKPIIKETIVEHKANRCYKKLFLWDHLVSMLYGVYTHCTSLRELQHGLEICQGKLNHLHLDRVPPRSTLSDGNMKRPSKVFETIYQKIYGAYKNTISDSRMKNDAIKGLYILDSSTVSLFKAILKPAGRKRKDGKSKGGMKVHTLLNADTNMPSFIKYTAAALHDQQFYAYIKELPDHSIIAFDKAYINYKQFDAFTARGIYYVTRQKENADYVSVEEFTLPNDAQHILKDERIKISYTENNQIVEQQMRRVAVYSAKYNRAFVYITNNFDLTAIEIAAIYANRWQIETFFKKLKQNFPLTYFFGDNSNAIEIQVWCALIALLLLDVTHKDHNSTMPFSILATIIRLHIMNYVALSVIIQTYKQKRKRLKKVDNPKPPPKKIIPPALQLKMKM